ncbi:hypothetical protein EJB05_12530 [Eragrostis curvula]|uniref:Uncharacterized protein n=1 Tax=Eragrostis curvula TaxID=38414 RepID=A0A5J9VU73_9POAL|nr:hypothetical protein EJB05_12530 [Eragrostis curvula]
MTSTAMLRRAHLLGELDGRRWCVEDELAAADELVAADELAGGMQDSGGVLDWICGVVFRGGEWRGI